MANSVQILSTRVYTAQQQQRKKMAGIGLREILLLFEQPRYQETQGKIYLYNLQNVFPIYLVHSLYQLNSLLLNKFKREIKNNKNFFSM